MLSLDMLVLLALAALIALPLGGEMAAPNLIACALSWEAPRIAPDRPSGNDEARKKH